VRLEGSENDACLDALPPVGRVQVTSRMSLFDDTLGTAVFVDLFRGLPDSHLFRLVGEDITSIHAITICDPTCAPPGTDGGAGAGGGGAGGGSGAGGVSGAGGASGASGAGGTGGASGASGGGGHAGGSGAGGRAGAGGAAGGGGRGGNN
jgi:hypothetical protein